MMGACVFDVALVHYLQEDMYIQAALSVDNPEYPVPDGVKRIEVRSITA